MVGVSMEEMRLFVCLFSFFQLGVRASYSCIRGKRGGTIHTHTHIQYHLASANITSEYGVTEENSETGSLKKGFF